MRRNLGIVLPMSVIVVVACGEEVAKYRLHRRRRRPTPYPPRFAIDFATNLTALDRDARHPVSGRLWYDWTTGRQRIDHGPGSYECAHFYDATDGCTLIFNGGGMYRLIRRDDDGNDDDVSCCLDLPGIGPPPPDWASNATTSIGTFRGLVYDVPSRTLAYQWNFDRSEEEESKKERYLAASGGRRQRRDATASSSSSLPYHSVREVAFGTYGGRPLAFTFPGDEANGRQDYHFSPESMAVGPFDPSVFALPDGCADEPCRREGRGGEKRNS